MITPSFGLTATERVLPNLALDFTTASLDPRVTFTRADNTATVTNSSGYVVPINADLPRFDYNPITLACKGLLIEESRKNLVLQSADFETSWIDQGTTTQTKNVVTSPANTTTGNQITSGTVGYSGVMQQPSITSSSNSYTGSCYLKAGTVTSVRLRLRFSTGGTTADGSAYFNLSAGTYTVDGGRTATITPVGNDWYRCTVTGADNNTGNTLGQLFVLSNNQQGNWYAWGAQLELGAFATSYIPTTTTQITRNADVATMTGTNFSSWFNATQGTFQANYLTGSDTTTLRTITASDGTSSNVLQIIGSSAGGYGPYFFSVVSGSGQALPAGATACSANTNYKVVGAYKASSFASSINGAAPSTSATGSVPTVSQFEIGSQAATANSFLNGWMKQIYYWPQRLTNNEVQAFSK